MTPDQQTRLPLGVKLRKAHDERMRSVVSPITDDSSHDHDTRGKPGLADGPRCRMGRMTAQTLGNGHATRMSPDRGHCRGSGLNDVHRGVGGTVVTASSPYAKFMTHNASLSIPAVWGAGGPFCACGRQIKTDSIQRKQRPYPQIQGGDRCAKSRFRSRSRCCSPDRRS